MVLRVLLVLRVLVLRVLVLRVLNVHRALAPLALSAPLAPHP
jgi:hypothetical protein